MLCLHLAVLSPPFQNRVIVACYLGIVADNEIGKLFHIVVKGINANAVKQVFRLFIRQQHHALAQLPTKIFQTAISGRRRRLARRACGYGCGCSCSCFCGCGCSWGSTVKYIVTNNLTNAKNSNISAYVESGAPYSATITAEAGYILDKVSCTMGGVEVEVVDGVITIESVNGDIVITATTIVDKEETVENAVYIYGGFYGNSAHSMNDEPVYNSSYPNAAYTSPILLEYIDGSHPNYLNIVGNFGGQIRVRYYDENGNFVSKNATFDGYAGAFSYTKYVRYVFLDTSTTTDGEPFAITSCIRTETLIGGTTETTEYTVIDRRGT